MTVRSLYAMSALRKASFVLLGLAALGGLLHSGRKARVLITNASHEVLDNVQLVGHGSVPPRPDDHEANRAEAPDAR